MINRESASDGREATALMWRLWTTAEKELMQQGEAMDRLPNIHPGEVLEEELLRPLGLTAYRLAKATKIPITRISEIVKGRRRVTADTALRLSTFFGNSPRFWLGLQNDYDLEEEQVKIERDLKEISPLKAMNM